MIEDIGNLEQEFSSSMSLNKLEVEEKFLENQYESIKQRLEIAKKKKPTYLHI